MVICLQQGSNDLRMIQLMPLPPHHLLLHYNPKWFNLFVASLPRFSGKKATKRVLMTLFKGEAPGPPKYATGCKIN